MPKLWRLILCLPLMVLISGASPPAETVTEDFCARLAKDSGIEKPTAPDGRTVWTVNALNFGQRFIFGGSATTGLSVKPENARPSPSSALRRRVVARLPSNCAQAAPIKVTAMPMPAETATSRVHIVLLLPP